MDSFYVTLPSDSSLELYPGNTPSKYTTKLKQSASLVGDYEVALTEIQYKFDFNNYVNEFNTPAFYIAIREEDLNRLVLVEPKYFEPAVYESTESIIVEHIAQLQHIMETLFDIGDTVLVPRLKGEDNVLTVWTHPKSAAKSAVALALAKYSTTTTSTGIDKWLESVVYALEFPTNLTQLVIAYLKQVMPPDDEIFTTLANMARSLMELEKSFKNLLSENGSSRKKRAVAQSQTMSDLSQGVATHIQTALGIADPAHKLIAQVSTQLAGVLREAEKQNKKLGELTEAVAAMPFQDDLANALKTTAVYSVVPTALLPYDMVNDHRKFRIPVVIPSGFYKDPPALVQALNWHLKHSCIVRNLNQYVYFSYDAGVSKITMHVNFSVSVKGISREFARQVGFHWYSDFDVTGLNTGLYPVRFHEHWQLMYIYSDVVDFSYVGHSMAQLLRVIPATGDTNAYTVVRFDSPHFMPVLKSDVSTLEVQLLNEYGEPFQIKSGKTILKLKFQPRVKHIF